MKTWIKVLLSLAVVGVLAAIAVYFFVYNKPHVNYEKAEPEITIRADDLFFEFVSNPEEAGQKYNGKVLQINGMLDDIESSEEMTFAVFAFSEGMFGKEGVRCSMLNAHAKELKSTNVGVELTIKGYCTGFTGTDVILEHGSIIE